MSRAIHNLLAYKIVDEILTNLRQNNNLFGDAEADHVKADLRKLVEDILYDASAACE